MYNYSKNYQENYQDTPFFENLKRELEKNKSSIEDYEDEFEEVINKVFVEEYKKILEKGTDAFEQLRNFYATNEAIAILINEPLDRWPTVVSRISKNER